MLNESQRRAVVTTEGPVMIVAGPGTGKTLTIVRRIAHLIHEKNIRPEQIVAITFTNRAAQEIRERTVSLLGTDVSQMFLGTFHVLGLKIIQDNLSDNHVIYNREEQLSILRDLLRKTPHKPQHVLEKISRIKNFLDEEDGEITKIYGDYQAQLAKKSAMDFDDLILKPIEVLGNNETAEKYSDAFRYIMVDEYQDINPAQYRFLKILAGEHANVCVIGDADQAIYAFRGSDVSNFLHFEEEFREAQRITLTNSYRSTGIILRASDALIKKNTRRIERNLLVTREAGPPVSVLSVPDERSEGEYIIREIEKRIGGISHDHVFARGQYYEDDEASSYTFSDFVVLYRTNMQARVLEECFTRSGIPFQVVGRKSLLKKQEIADTLKLLKSVLNPLYEQELTGTSLKNIDAAILGRFRLLKDSLPLPEFLEAVLMDSGLKAHYGEEKFGFIANLASSYQGMKPASALACFVNELNLLSPGDEFDTNADAVSLMTLHMAKGLEFRVVFITGVEEGIIPYIKNEQCDMEEERRLFYVGMTRASNELFLIHARKRFLYGQTRFPAPSPFLADIPETLRQHTTIHDRQKKQKTEKQIGLF